MVEVNTFTRPSSSVATLARIDNPWGLLFWSRASHPEEVAPGASWPSLYAGAVTRSPNTPAPLLVAASLVALEGLLLALLAVVELGSLSSERLMLGLTTTVFFLAYAALLVWAARAVTRGRSWARSPIVLSQLILLGLAWNNRDTPVVAGALAVVAVVVIAGLLHPDSIEALADEPERGEDRS